MLDSLQMIYTRLIDEVKLTHYRSLYHQFSLSSRLIGLVGPRGVGKTTLILQYIKNNYSDLGKTFYFSADHIYFKSNLLYEFVESLYLQQGIRVFFIDEIHKYENWSQELKNLYDGFPDLSIVFSGSSSLDLVKGAYDLSRRAKMYHLPGVSFREYLNFKENRNIKPYSFDDLTNKYADIGSDLLKIPGVIQTYHEYLMQGYYPFFKEDPTNYYEKLLIIIEKTIYEDISNFYNLKTFNLRHLSKILNFLVGIPPGQVSTYNLGKNLDIDDKTAAKYLQILKETGLVEIIYPAETGNSGLRKPEKVFLQNTNLHYALSSTNTKNIDNGTIRELAFIQAIISAGLTASYSKNGDYQIKGKIFEVGGKNKTRRQIKGMEEAYLVKDDTLNTAVGNIPLFFFGFLY